MIHLYVKTHNITGLKYFGKTVQDPHKYRGSGKYWKAHIAKHGYDVHTEVVGSYKDPAECCAAALAFSREHNIVESSEWANLIEENGMDGAPIGHPGHTFTAAEREALSRKITERWNDPTYKERLSQRHKDRWTDDVRAQQSNRLKNEFWTEERKAAHSAKMSGREASERFLAFTRSERAEEHKRSISAALTGKQKTEEHKQKLRTPKPLVVCRIEDRKLMAIGNFMNWLKRVTSAERDIHSRLPSC